MQLLDSVHPKPLGEHDAWTHEIRQRLERVQAGNATLIDADQVLARYHAQRQK